MSNQSNCLLKDLDIATPPVSDIELARFEKTIGLRLPDDYRIFLKNYRGGVIYDGLIFPVVRPRRVGTESIEVFFGLTDDPVCSIFAYHKVYCLDQNRMMPGMIPIGCDAGSNNICILLSKEHFGEIYYWDHNLEVDFDDSEDAEEAFRNCYFIADSFTKFLSTLRAWEE
ncbi:MAG: SMI1/KNR4 family protein [Sphingobacteriales bacterium]|nr:MAG: SMI1/KNR4 family protein [Sphingobacteriales bacterium]